MRSRNTFINADIYIYYQIMASCHHLRREAKSDILWGEVPFGMETESIWTFSEFQHYGYQGSRDAKAIARTTRIQLEFRIFRWQDFALKSETRLCEGSDRAWPRKYLINTLVWLGGLGSPHPIMVIHQCEGQGWTNSCQVLSVAETFSSIYLASSPWP